MSLTNEPTHRLPSSAAELIVCDDCQPCPYLTDQVARMPLRLPVGRLTPRQMDDLLASGNRRSGRFLYRTRCPSCCACEPIRIPVSSFLPRRSERRIVGRGDQLLQMHIDQPKVDQQRVDLFNLHRQQRGLAAGDDQIDARGYEEFLVDSCCDSIELTYTLEDRLVGVAIADLGHHSISAVYFYFDPSQGRLSPGTYSILKQIELCRRWDKAYLYLGLFIAQSPHMSYKARFVPHQRLIDGCWQWYQHWP